MEKILKVGVMPGKIGEVAIETGATIEQVLSIAGLDASGYEIKVDGNKVDSSYQVQEADNMVLLVKMVKGNANGVLKVGVMPGKIGEIAVEPGATVGSALEIAELDPSGFEIKLDGVKVSTEDTISNNSNMLLLVKMVKGNR